MKLFFRRFDKLWQDSWIVQFFIEEEIKGELVERMIGSVQIKTEEELALFSSIPERK